MSTEDAQVARARELHDGVALNALKAAVAELRKAEAPGIVRALHVILRDEHDADIRALGSERV